MKSSSVRWWMWLLPVPYAWIVKEIDHSNTLARKIDGIDF